MENYFTEIYGLDSTESIEKRFRAESREVPSIDESAFTGSPSAKYTAQANKIVAKAFASAVIGEDIDDIAVAPAISAQHEQLCKRAGLVGEKLLRLSKASSSLPEGMRKMVENFAEFFTAEDRSLLAKAIAALDLPLFFQIVNARVYA